MASRAQAAAGVVIVFAIGWVFAHKDDDTQAAAKCDTQVQASATLQEPDVPAARQACKEHADDTGNSCALIDVSSKPFQGLPPERALAVYHAAANARLAINPPSNGCGDKNTRADDGRRLGKLAQRFCGGVSQQKIDEHKANEKKAKRQPPKVKVGQVARACVLQVGKGILACQAPKGVSKTAAQLGAAAARTILPRIAEPECGS